MFSCGPPFPPGVAEANPEAARSILGHPEPPPRSYSVDSAFLRPPAGGPCQARQAPRHSVTFRDGRVLPPGPTANQQRTHFFFEVSSCSSAARAESHFCVSPHPKSSRVAVPRRCLPTASTARRSSTSWRWTGCPPATRAAPPGGGQVNGWGGREDRPARPTACPCGRGGAAVRSAGLVPHGGAGHGGPPAIGRLGAGPHRRRPPTGPPPLCSWSSLSRPAWGRYCANLSIRV